MYHDEVTHHAWNLDSKGKAIQQNLHNILESIISKCISPWRVLCSDDRVALRREVYKNGLIEADRRIGEFVEFLKKQINMNKQ